MHFHLPKPLHGWREFAGEVGIIVIGVLIALGAEQLVETARLSQESDAARHAVRVQLSHAAGVYDERVQVQPCLDRRLKELDALLRQVRVTGKLPDVGEIGRAPVRPVPSSAWSTASQSGLAMRFPAAERDLLSMHYAQSAEYPREVQDEDEMWATLEMLKHAPGPIDGALAADATITLERLKFRSFLNGINAAQQLEAIHELGVRADYFVVTNEGEKPGRAGMLQRVRQRSICQQLLVDGKPYSPAS
jgi:hypothetical protein